MSGHELWTVGLKASIQAMFEVCPVLCPIQATLDAKVKCLLTRWISEVVHD